MNWKRGLLRLWVVLSAIWIGIGVILSNPVFQIEDALKNVEFSYDGSILEFPHNTPTAVIKKVLSKFISQDRAKPTTGVPDQLDDSPQDVASKIVGDYQPRRISPILYSFAAIAFAPPVAILIITYLFVWVVRGFRTTHFAEKVQVSVHDDTLHK